MQRDGRPTVERHAVIEALLLALVLFATNIRGLVVSVLLPFGGAIWEAAIEFCVFLVALWILWRSRRLGFLATVLGQNLPLIAFSALAVASAFWTIDVASTTFRVLALVLSTTLAAYLAARYSMQEILGIAAVLFGALAVLCVLTVAAWPNFGQMNFYPYDGSWRGIFWHRNYLGSTMALGTTACLLGWSSSIGKTGKKAALYAVVYLLTLALVILTRSATALILVIVLHAAVGVAAAWVRWRSKLHRIHYYVAGALLAAGSFVAYGKADFLLGLFKRSSTFTGRVGLWTYLQAQVISRRPLFGHGFGALWQQIGFQRALQQVVGWPYPVVIGDNGYMDILLHLGYVGLAVFIAALTIAVVRSLSYALREGTLAAFAPVLVLAWMLLANVTLSYFLETESFTWFVTMSFIFAAMLPAPKAEARRAKMATSVVA